MSEKADPNRGGCWYCWVKDEKLLFSWEMDTYIHIECILKALNDPEDYEAVGFKEEFGL